MKASLIHLTHRDAFQADRTSRRDFRKPRS
jgi:hypothetical protein